MPTRLAGQRTARYAQMFSALGTEPRLRIMRVLLSAHSSGLFAGEIATELGNNQASTLSHHLENLKHEVLNHRAVRRNLSSPRHRNK